MQHDIAAAGTEAPDQQQALIHALSQQKHTLLYFHSAACNLCRSISGVVSQEHARRSQSLSLCSICTDGTQAFAPEMLNYDVQSVPCFVLLDKKGLAVAKSDKPRSKGHVTAALSELLSLVPQQQPHPHQQVHQPPEQLRQ